MAPLSSPKKTGQKRKRLKKSLKSLIEFRGGSQVDQSQFQSTTRKLYDGPAGAVLYLASKLSLHDPLVGRIIKTRRFDVTEFRSILDIGSGAGQILGHLLRETHPEARLVACDLSHQMLKRARSRMDSQRPNYLSADLTNLPFLDESFDCVTCGWVLEYVADPRHGLSEIHRVLQPGGSLFLLATEDKFSGMLNSRTWKCRTYNRIELQQAFEESGLPWKEQLWFTPIHQFLKLGGIIVEATKPTEPTTMSSQSS